jgi:hypothetical protein
VGDALGSAPEVGLTGRRQFASTSGSATAVAPRDRTWDHGDVAVGVPGAIKQSQGGEERELPSILGKVFPFPQSPCSLYSDALARRRRSSFHPHGAMGTIGGH